MQEKQERGEDIKTPVEKIFKDLTQKYVRELVKEATKGAVKEKGKKDAQELEEALRNISDSEREKLFRDSANEIRQNIYEGKTKDKDFIKEFCKIIDKQLSPHKIGFLDRGEKGPSLWRRFWTRILLVAKIAILIVIIIMVAYLILEIFGPKPPVDGSLDRTSEVEVTSSTYRSLAMEIDTNRAGMDYSKFDLPLPDVKSRNYFAALWNLCR